MNFGILKAALLAGWVSGLLAQDPPPKAAKSILLLSPQGIDPSKDTANFNGTVQKITQAFSGKLAEMLKAKGVDSTFVIDQDPKYVLGQKLAIYSYKHKTTTAIVMTMESVAKDGGYDLSLKLQFTESEFITNAEGKQGITTLSTLAREIPLATAKGGWSNRSLTDMVSEYVQFLEGAHKL